MKKNYVKLKLASFITAIIFSFNINAASATNEIDNYKAVLKSIQTVTCTPTIAISVSNNTICGSSAVFTSTITDGGSSPVYQWKKNGNNVGTGLTTYSPNNLLNGDVVSCILTSDLSCATQSIVTSNSITIVAASSFSATITQQGNDLMSSSSGNLNWYINGMMIPSATNQTYTPISTGYFETVETIGTCSVSSNTYPYVYYSTTYCIPNSLNGTVLGDYIGGVVLGSINNPYSLANQDPNYTNYSSLMSTSLTQNTTYSLAVTGGYNYPNNYAAWIDYNNDNDFDDVDEKIGEFVSSTVLEQQNIVFTVPLTSSLGTTRLRVRGAYSVSLLDPCTDSNEGETEDYAIDLQAASINTCTPSITISAPSNTICGSSAVFTSTITDGGSSPMYQWKKNGNNVGSGLPNYSPTNLINGDVISCILTSDLSCATQSVVVSNSVAIVAASSFSATINEQGNDLISSSSGNIQWYLNGNLIPGATSQTYTPISSGYFQVVETVGTCTVASVEYDYTYFSSTYCIPNPSNGITEDNYIDGVVLGTINNTDSGSNLNSNYTNYSASMSTALIQNTTYSLLVAGGNSQPDTYAAWIDYNIDGDFNDADEKLGEFYTTTIFGIEHITFTVPSNSSIGMTKLRVRVVNNEVSIDACTDYDLGETEDYTIDLQAASTNTCAPSITISAPSNTICSSSAVFTSTITDGGSSPIYQWQKNGNNVGSGLDTYSPTDLINGDVVSCILTSDLSCATQSVVMSNSITIVLVSSFSPTITQQGNDLISSEANDNQWYLNGSIIPGATSQIYTPISSGSFEVGFSNGTCFMISSVYNYVYNSTTYCIPNPTNGTIGNDYIDGVVIESINNINSGSVNGPNYTDYSSFMSTNLTQNATYSLEVTGGNTQQDAYAAWIDYNNNGDFNDAGEKLGEFATTSVFETQTIVFTVPSNTSLGFTRLRVRGVYNVFSLDACTSYTFGETEDYAVALQAAITNTCDPSINISTTSNTICGSSAVFTSTITNGGSLPIYQWKKNGNNVGSGLASYSPTSLINGDVISCVLKSDVSCATQSVVTSNSIMIYVDVCTGVEADTKLTHLMIYPNPNNGSFTINSSVQGVYAIQNELGQTIQTLTLSNANNYTMTIDNLSNGIYFVVGLSNKTTLHQKIVVVK